MKLGNHILDNNLFLAPMSGITDSPFRNICRQQGAGLTVSEMVTANPGTRTSRKTQQRLNHEADEWPRSVQIAGANPGMMAEAAKYNADRGADIIDINMGCPAKKVCNTRAGSALLKDEGLVARILEHVVKAVDVPVTLKLRTGWDRQHKNALAVAGIAQDSGIQALFLHGRTRECGFSGEAEHDTAALIKSRISIPLIVNGDIGTPEQAVNVLSTTKADGIMIGRAARGNPWIFREIGYHLKSGEKLSPPDGKEIKQIILGHLENIYRFYGEYLGVRIARKHISWYCMHRQCNDSRSFRIMVNRAETIKQQYQIVSIYFNFEPTVESVT